jgi:hypothetical protein
MKHCPGYSSHASLWAFEIIEDTESTSKYRKYVLGFYDGKPVKLCKEAYMRNEYKCDLQNMIQFVKDLIAEASDEC